MKCLILAMLLLLACLTPARAQDPFNGALPPIQNRPSTDVWESQDPRYDTPAQAVRRKAAWKAAQRRQRLADMKRIGYSPSRPPSSPLPFMGSPTQWILVPSFFPTTIVVAPYAAAVDSRVVR